MPPSSVMPGPYRRAPRTCSAASRNGGNAPTDSRISRVPGWIAVARASRCGRTSRSMSRASTPWRASSAAANRPEGPAPMIKTSWGITRSPLGSGQFGDSGRGEQGDHQGEKVIRPIAGFLLAENDHGVGSLDEAEAGQTPRGGHGGGRLAEGLGHEGDPRDASLLAHQRVQTTARAARPSVADPRDD